MYPNTNYIQPFNVPTMSHNPPLNRLVSRACASAGLVLSSPAAAVTAAIAFVAATPAVAQQAASGIVQGRVMNAMNGNYLSKAKLSVVGTNIETLTNDYGEYELRNLPAGSVTIQVTFTGQEPLTSTVVVEAGQSVSKNFAFNATDPGFDADSGTLTLDAFVVESNRMRTAQEIANNEERNSVNIKNVVAADSLGYIGDGNIGNFVQFLPGVDINYGGDYSNDSDPSSISVRGFGPEDTAVMIDGVPVASASTGSLTRTVGLDMLSINNASRIEILKVSTPDMPNNSPGGAVNLVTRSAFEFARPSFDFDLTLSMNTAETSLFKKKPGPAEKKTYHSLPSGRISMAVPVTKTFGFTVSVASDNKFATSLRSQPRWKVANQNINLAPIGGPSGNTPITNANGPISYANPSLDRSTVNDVPFNSFKQSGNIKLDWRPIPTLKLTGNAQYSRYDSVNVDRRAQFQLGAAEDWGADFVRGYQYRTSSASVNGSTFNPGHSSSMTITTRDKKGDTTSGYIKANFRKGPFTIDGLFSRSISNGSYVDMKNGHFSGLDLSVTTGRIDFYGISKGTPSEIRVWDRNGNPIDYSDFSNWVVGSTINAQSGETWSKDTVTDAKLHMTYELDFMPFYTALKFGGDRSIKHIQKGGKGTGFKMRYIGPQLTADQLRDDHYSTAPVYGLVAPQQWASTYKLYDIFEANPEMFDADFQDPTGTTNFTAENYNSATTQTKSVKETRDSYFAMVEARLFDNRLYIVGGARQTKKSVKGVQPYVDSKFNYVKLPNGAIYTDDVYINGVQFNGATGRMADGNNYAADAILTDMDLRARMIAAGVVIPTKIERAPNGTTNGNQNNNETLAKLRLQHRPIDISRREPATPSLQGRFDITDKLQLKLAWSRETRLQNIESSTHGGILTGGSSFNINENLVHSGVPGGQGTITMSNPDLQPEITNSWNAELSYRTSNGGKISVSYFYKITENLWDDTELYDNSPEYAAILRSFGLDPADYVDWRITSTTNSAAEAKRDGIEAEISQNMGFLSRWTRGIDVFATYSHRPNAAADAPENETRGWIAKLPTRDKYTGGISFSTQRFSLQVRGIYTEGGISRQSVVSFVPPGESVAVRHQFYNILPHDLRLNIQAGYKISKRYSVFAQGQNILNGRRFTRRGDVMTGIQPEYASYAGQTYNGVALYMGVRGSF